MSSATVADDTRQRCRAGLAAAAAALYGAHAETTAAALHARRSADAPAWPWLPGLCYQALGPLHVAFPDDDRAAVVAGKVLVGRPVRPDRVAAARRALGGAPASGRAPDPRLATAVDAFWAELTDVAEQLGRSVRAGDDDAVERLVAQARPRLRRAARAVHAAAQAWSAAVGPATPSRPRRDARGRAAPEPEVVPVRARADAPPAEPRRPPAAAPTPRCRPRSEPSAPAEPTPAFGDDDATLGPDRPYAPLVFAGAAVALSLLLLLLVAAGWLDFG